MSGRSKGGRGLGKGNLTEAEKFRQKIKKWKRQDFLDFFHTYDDDIAERRQYAVEFRDRELDRLKRTGNRIDHYSSQKHTPESLTKYIDQLNREIENPRGDVDEELM